jgi:hypothetical protein
MRSFLLLIAALGFALSAQAQTAGTVTHLSGMLSVKRADGTSKVLSVKSEVKPGDLLTTEDETYARIKFADNSEMVLRPNTQVKVDSFAFNQAKPESDNVAFSMLKGGLRAVTGLIGKRNHDKVNFTTTTATIGIRGTHFGALLCQNDCGGVPTTSGHAPPNGLHVDVADGAILVKNGAGQIQINAGQFGFVANANTPPVTVPPQSGIQVTMPSSISQNKGGGHGIGKGKEGECAL